MSVSLKTAFAPLNGISRSFTSGATASSFKYLNTVLENDWLRSLLLIIVSIFAGYTLQPVPTKLNNIFNTSTSFKYMILFVLLLTAFYPLDNRKVILSLVIPILTLALFEFLRKVDDMDFDEEFLGGNNTLHRQRRKPKNRKNKDKDKDKDKDEVEEFGGKSWIDKLKPATEEKEKEIDDEKEVDLMTGDIEDDDDLEFSGKSWGGKSWGGKSWIGKLKPATEEKEKEEEIDDEKEVDLMTGDIEDDDDLESDNDEILIDNDEKIEKKKKSIEKLKRQELKKNKKRNIKNLGTGVGNIVNKLPNVLVNNANTTVDKNINNKINKKEKELAKLQKNVVNTVEKATSNASFEKLRSNNFWN